MIRMIRDTRYVEILIVGIKQHMVFQEIKALTPSAMYIVVLC